MVESGPLFPKTVDLTLSVQEIIEYYGARWKIEATFEELKRDIGSAETQTRHPNADKNHLHFVKILMTSVSLSAITYLSNLVSGTFPLI